MSGRGAKGLQREHQILQAAAEVIAERGLGDVRLADIAERAGMSPGHVTYYFPAKAELLMQAIRRSEDEFQVECAAELRGMTDPRRALRRLIELATPRGAGDPGWLLWLEVWASAGTHTSVASTHDELDAWWRDTLTEVIRQGRSTGTFTSNDPETAAVLLSALIDGLSVQLTLGAPGMTRDRLLALCWQAAQAQLGFDPL